MPRPERLEDHYDQPPASYWTQEALEWSADYFADTICRVKNLLPFSVGMSALDVGAGLGKCMRSLAVAGFDAWGLEPSKPFWESALSAGRILPERLQLASVESADYPADSFDFITFGAVLEHLYEPADAIRRSLHWLKSGGIIHIEVPSAHHLVARCLNLYYRLIGTNYVTHLSPMHNPYHIYEFTLKSFQHLGSRLGFKVAEYEFHVCEIFHFPRFTHSVLRRFMEATYTGMQLTVYLRKT